MQTNQRDGRSQGRAQAGATDCYTSPQIAARNRLASCPALAILSPGCAGVPPRNDPGGWQDLRGNAGILEQGYCRIAGCLWRGKTARPPLPRSPPAFNHAPCLPNETFAWDCGRSGTCCSCRREGGGSTRFTCAPLREMRRSMSRRNRVNSFPAVTLSLELCSRFLNQLALPVNIAYERQIMSRVSDMSGQNRFLVSKEPRVVDATG